MEYDDRAKKVRSLSASWQLAASDWLNLVGGYSQRRQIDYAESTITETKYRLDNSLNLSTTLRSPGNRFGGSYTFNYDIDRSKLLNSRVIGYYNAQCCGFAVEYQTVSSSQLVAGEGQPVQLLVHPGGPRHLLQLLRRAGRRRRAIAAGTHQR